MLRFFVSIYFMRATNTNKVALSLLWFERYKYTHLHKHDYETKINPMRWEWRRKMPSTECDWNRSQTITRNFTPAMWHEISKYAANILDDFIHWQRLLLHSFLMIHAILGIIIDEDYSKWYRLFLPWIRNNFRHVVHVIQKRINTWSFEKKK